MNVRKTEEFLYFQNKARHYANLRDVRPAVKSHRQSPRWTSPDDPNRVPYFKRYDMERQNQGLINRITDILTGPKHEIDKHGYTRYNPKTSRKSHFTIEQKKADETIDHGNERIAHMVLKAKPSIGTIDNWNKNYQNNRKIRSNISKYTNERNSKGTLDLYTSTKFMPSHYRSFLNQSLDRKGGQQHEENPELSHNLKIRVEQLFQLPKLRRIRGSLTRIGDDGQQVQHF